MSIAPLLLYRKIGLLVGVDSMPLRVEGDTTDGRLGFTVTLAKLLSDALGDALVLMVPFGSDAGEGHLATLYSEKTEHGRSWEHIGSVLTLSGKRTMVPTMPLSYTWLQVLLEPVQTARMLWLIAFASQSRMVHPAAGVRSEMAVVEPLCFMRVRGKVS